MIDAPSSLEALFRRLSERVKWLRAWHLADDPRPIPAPFLEAIIERFGQDPGGAPAEVEARRSWANERVWRFSELTVQQTHAILEQLDIFDGPAPPSLNPETNDRCMIDALDHLTALRTFVAQRIRTQTEPVSTRQPSGEMPAPTTHPDDVNRFLSAMDRWSALCKSWSWSVPRSIATSDAIPQDAEEARGILAELAAVGPRIVPFVAAYGGDSKLVAGWIDAQDKSHFDKWTRQVWEQVRLEVMHAQLLAAGTMRDDDAFHQSARGQSPSPSSTASFHEDNLIGEKRRSDTKEQVRSPRESSPFIPSELQERILEALDKKALTLDALAEQLDIERSALHRDGIKELMAENRIANHRRVGGYYRLDAPPPKYAALLGKKKS
jgi:hypothetical protein